MAGEDLLTYTGQAAIAYQDALNQAKNTQNALLRQYGFTAPGAGGGYSVEGAQAAFDPNVLFNKATGKVDEAGLASLVGCLQSGGTGLLANISRAGATGEAEAIAGQRARGFGGDIGGGLMTQARQGAETASAGQMSQAKSEFISSLGGALSPIGGAWQGLQTATAQDEASRLASEAARASIVAPVPPTPEVTAPTAPGKYATSGTPGGKPPTSPRGGQLYTGPGGVKWQYRMNGPSGKGWYK